MKSHFICRIIWILYSEKDTRGEKCMSIILYHYFDSKIGPFRNLSDLPDEEVDRVILKFRQQKRDSFCAKRTADYMRMRRYDENILREEFQKKGGMIIGDVDDVILNTVGGEYIRCSVRQFGHIA